MRSNSFLIPVYVTYAAVSIGLIVWLARTLFAHGAVFLEGVFDENPKMAEAVNRLLVTGFYMLNLGYALYILRASRGLDAFAAIQFLVNRLALLLVTLAGLHFVNVFVFWRIRARREQRHMHAPVAPQMMVPPTPASEWK